METELCAIAPADWQIRSVEDICVRVTSGGTPSRREPAYYADGTWPWVKTQELQDKWIDDTEEHITEEAVASSSAKVLPAHTVLVAMYGATVGQLGILRRPMTCNQACSALIVNPAEADYRFLYFQLLQVRSQLKSLATGAAQQNLSGVLIKSLRLPFPPVEEQRAIAQFLGTLDDKIELNRRMNETLEAMARALFKSWFVDFDPVRAKAEGRDPGLPKPLADLFPDSFEDSELGEIPTGWEVGTIYKIADVVYGAPFASSQFNTEGLGKPLIRIRDLADESPGVWTPEVHPKGYVVRPGDVVVGMDGEFRAYLWGGAEAWLNQRVCVFVPKGSASAAFVRNSIIEPLAHIEATETATTVIHLGKGDIDRFVGVVPSDEVLAAFNAHCQPWYERIVAGKRDSRTLAALRDTLLPKLISGELRVKDTERFVPAGVA
ncbi:MAG: restriction endonuclease subunit S [Candidatus Eisenbacteria bacterium]|uniref:Restriction endonuclease subunit S n=1 Tax=Eiseniibacteriota bacterium TaxID=2212470 RepID=A0A849SMS7_UNCEI|nr:restriction endonuclease subunit S [Candidatus Eisenbacteria bacterium]